MGYQQWRSAFCTAHVIVETDFFFFHSLRTVTVPFNWKWTFSLLWKGSVLPPDVSHQSLSFLFPLCSVCVGIVGYPRWTHLWWDIKEFVFLRACVWQREEERGCHCVVCALLCLLCTTLFLLAGIAHPLALCGKSLQWHSVIDVNYKVNTTFVGHVHVLIWFTRHGMNSTYWQFFSLCLKLPCLPF